MNGASDPTAADGHLTTATETAIRIVVVALLAAWCFQIVRPFIVPIVWGIIIAIAAYPVYGWFLAILGGRRGPASALFSLMALLILIAPLAMLSATLLENSRQLADMLREGTLDIPAPPEQVASWPVIGEALYSNWTLAHGNLEALVAQFQPQIVALSQWLLAAVAGAGITTIQFIVSIFIAGILMARSESGLRVAHSIFTRLAGDRGAEFAALSGTMVRSVARGILGVAVIQSILAGLGFLAAGVPGAGLLSVLCLILGVVQIGPTLVLIPVVIWVFSAKSTGIAIVFLIWSIFVALIDNVLKPLLLGRGIDVPMVVVFIGAIGGFLSMGIIGLFVGAIVLVLGYTLSLTWFQGEAVGAPGEASGESTTAGT